MKRLLYVILNIALAIHASAQVKVTGRVTDPQAKPVSDVIVKLVSGTKTLAFTTTNTKGDYALELKSTPAGEVDLQFSHISYEKESKRMTLKERSTKTDMVMTPKDISLQEVTVKPDPLRQRGDTLSHNLASFLGKGDVTLEDGLRRLPGVDVSNSGGISYMGKPISQFNIEGMDLLGGQYNLATRNIPADYVTNVEIVRNHHSRRVEKDVPSNEVSMNIKLANKAKFKPFGQEEVGAGHMEDGRDRLQALLGLTGMMFTNSFQTICSLKGGNYKNFGNADLTNHFGGSDVSTPATSLFGGFDGGGPPQGQHVYRRNGMATVNTNALGFTRMIGEAYRYFAELGEGHIAAVTSIAGTKGLGPAPSYSATKAFQNLYLQALEQQANARKLKIRFTDIRPGFVDTDLLNGDFHYPMMLRPEKAALQIVSAIDNKRHIKVIDWRYRLLTPFWRCLPNLIWRHLKI